MKIKQNLAIYNNDKWDINQKIISIKIRFIKMARKINKLKNKIKLMNFSMSLIMKIY